MWIAALRGRMLLWGDVVDFSDKHSGSNTISLTDFTGGLNTVSPKYAIADNELSEAINIEFDNIGGYVRSRNGTGNSVVSFDDDIRAVYRHNLSGFVLVVSGLKLYAYDFINKIFLGNLTGNSEPRFCEFDGKTYIASGGVLQVVAGNILKNVPHSPTCDNVAERFGRLVITKEGIDRINYSAVGDPENWVGDTDDVSASVWLEVGYKDGYSIITFEPMMQDIIVFKGRRIYRVLSEYPDWQVLTVSTKSKIANKHCCTHLGGAPIYLDVNDGLMEVSAVQDYGDVRIKSVLSKVDTHTNINENSARLWNLRSKQCLVIKKNDVSDLIVYNYFFNACTLWRFPSAVSAMYDYDGMVLVCAGKHLYILNSVGMDFNGTKVVSRMALKSINGEYTIKRMKPYFRRESVGNVRLKTGKINWLFGIHSEDLSDPINDTIMVTDDRYISTSSGGKAYLKNQVSREDNPSIAIECDGGRMIFERIDVKLAVVGVR